MVEKKATTKKRTPRKRAPAKKAAPAPAPQVAVVDIEEEKEARRLRSWLGLIRQGTYEGKDEFWPIANAALENPNATSETYRNAVEDINAKIPYDWTVAKWCRSALKGDVF